MWKAWYWAWIINLGSGIGIPYAKDDKEVDVKVLGENLNELCSRFKEEFKNITYYGRGEIENYWDKYKSAKVGLYEDIVTEKMVDYLQPQENGAKTDVRYLEIKNEKGEGIKISGVPTFEFNISKYHPEDVEIADHFYKLKPLDATVLRIIYKQMGVGGDDSWRALPHPEYILNPNKIYTLTYEIKPI